MHAQSNAERTDLSKWVSKGLLILIALFAVSSVGNVSEFIYKYHPSGWAYVLGGAYGMVVFICAYITSTATGTATKAAAFVVGLVFAAASGYFQADIYVKGGATQTTANLLAYLPVIFGEIGLAIVEAYYSKDKIVAIVSALKEQIATLTADIEALTQRLTSVTSERDTLQTTLADVTVERDTMSQDLSAARVTIEDLLRQIDTLKTQAPPLLSLLTVTDADIETDEDDDTTGDDMSAQEKKEVVRRRRMTIRDRLRDIVDPALIPYAAWATEFSVTDRTIRRDIEALKKSKLVTVNGSVKVN